jgi:hypothetical protein
LKSREEWSLLPFVVGDIIDKNTGVHMDDDDQIDLRRLGEAVRYTLELLTALKFAERHPTVEMLFLHGPLVNTFVMYDEGEPHFIPFLKKDFLAQFCITPAAIEAALSNIPVTAGNQRMSCQFMAVYGYLLHQMAQSQVPLIGVVERSAGTWLAQAVLDKAVEANIVKEDYKRKVVALLKRYNIADDFLFGCVLAEGEYVTPTLIKKNEKRRAREKWQQVVEQYKRPFATLLKTTETSFPFRVEMNEAANARQAHVMRTLYHTARLLPRYAFPVGLDIVDKYAKVPDWLSKNISARAWLHGCSIAPLRKEMQGWWRRFAVFSHTLQETSSIGQTANRYRTCLVITSAPLWGIRRLTNLDLSCAAVRRRWATWLPCRWTFPPGRPPRLRR